jgi:hypothetical protein
MVSDNECLPMVGMIVEIAMCKPSVNLNPIG